MQQFSLEGKEASRRARDELFGLQNSRKAYTGMLAGLQNPGTLQNKQEREADLLDALAKDSGASDLANAWTEIAAIQHEKAQMLGKSVSFRSSLFGYALQLVLLAAEDQKPNEQRLRGYTDAARESLLQSLLSTAPVFRIWSRSSLLTNCHVSSKPGEQTIRWWLKRWLGKVHANGLRNLSMELDLSRLPSGKNWSMVETRELQIVLIQ